MNARLAGLIALAALTSACSTLTTKAPPAGAPVARPAPISPAAPPASAVKPGAKPINAAAAGVVRGPALASLGVTPDAALRALAAFKLSCGELQRRSDLSGLTQSGDWNEACATAATWPEEDARDFFASQFDTVIVGDGASFATGYYEPEILGSRTRQPGYDVPVYRKPPDLIEADLGLFQDELKGKRIRGQINGQRLILYPDRAAIEDGALANRGLELAWAADPIEFFFLQIQGSGRLRLPDGSIMRIGYDNQNGREFVGIGRVLRDRGLLVPGQLSMQGVMAWLRANPEQGRALMRENKSFVFFRELTGAGPIGAMGVAVVGKGSVAADPAFVPLGAPVVLALDRTEANGLWVTQDTGGAIKGANRFDTFWGAGDEARLIAGGMSGRGKAWLLLPKVSVARLTGAGDGQATARP